MKQLFFKQRLEIIFSISLIAIMGLPPLVLAQDQKSIEIKIINGDTTINGKDIKKLSAQERKEALGEIDKTGNITFKQTDKDGRSDIVIRRNKNMRRDGNKDVTIERRMFGNADNNASPYRIEFDTDDSVRAGRPFRLKAHTFKKMNGDSTFALRLDEDRTFNLRDDRGISFNGERPMRIERRFRFDGPGRGGERMMENRRNTQTFNYANTDDNGITNRVNFLVTDGSTDVLKRLTGAEKATLVITDLNLTPEFSTGKTALSFNLATKTAATVKLTDSEGKILYTDKVMSGSFGKKINIPQNGIYYLIIKQGTNVAFRKIIKEQ